MKISYNWLQSYFDTKLPEPEKVRELLTFHSFEIESIEMYENDHILDIKVLPDRAHDCLSHVGIAKEISVLTGLELKKNKTENNFPESNVAKIEIEDSKLCPRFSLLIVENVEVKESPDWLKEKLESIGQRSINNIVDITNFIMFGIGQPLHAYDLEKLSGGEDGAVLGVRFAQEGEALETLGGKKNELKKENIVIVDVNSGKAIGVAGVKGGAASKIDKKTKNIVIEAANFDPVSIRISSKSLNLRTDASVRFENGISPALTVPALEEASKMIMELASNGGTRIEGLADFYPRPKNNYKIGITSGFVNKILGLKLSDEEVEKILEKAHLKYEKIKDPISHFVDCALKLEGTKYKYGASVLRDSPKEFDCSGLVAYCAGNSGIILPRVSADQYIYCEKIDKNEVNKGDLIFALTPGGIGHRESKEWMPGSAIPDGVDHVGIMISKDKVFHTSVHNDNGARIDTLEDFLKTREFRGFGRIPDFGEGHRIVVTIPEERLDLRMKEDLVEEIGRIYGYENIETQKIETLKNQEINKIQYYSDLIRTSLVSEGFSEVITYAMQSKGEVEIENPLSSEKAYMRESLVSGISDSVEMALNNYPILGLDKIRIFEIGKIFKKDGERLSLGIAIKNLVGGKKESEEELIYSVKNKLEEILLQKINLKNDGEVWTLDLEETIEKLPMPHSNVQYQFDDAKFKFEKISSYPFVLRDIAIFVPENINSDEVSKLIKNVSRELLVKIYLFDEFRKDNQVSYAHRLVFQSQDRTLTDVEINVIMDEIVREIKNKGWTVR